MNTIEQAQQLKTIADMLERTRYNIRSNSIFYLIWGWLVLLSVLIEYILLTQFNSPYHFMVWIISMPLAGVSSSLAGRKHRLKQKHTSLMDSVMKFLWIGITMGIFFSLAFSNVIGWTHSYVLIILFYGIGTFVSGGVLKFKPLTIGGILSIVLSFVIAFIPDLHKSFENVLLLLALSVTMSYLIPGYLLRSKVSLDV